jgi:hypothetical protein
MAPPHHLAQHRQPAVTAVQLALDDCDPAWADGVPRPRKRRKRRGLSVLEPGQLTRKQRRRMTTIRVSEEYL